MQTDNACPPAAKVTLDFMKRTVVKRTPHSPSSLDLAPSDFYRLGHVKQLLRKYEFADREALLHAIEDILRGTEK
jgi:hypothetical protein